MQDRIDYTCILPLIDMWTFWSISINNTGLSLPGIYAWIDDRVMVKKQNLNCFNISISIM